MYKNCANIKKDKRYLQKIFNLCRYGYCLSTMLFCGDFTVLTIETGWILLFSCAAFEEWNGVIIIPLFDWISVDVELIFLVIFLGLPLFLDGSALLNFKVCDFVMWSFNFALGFSLFNEWSTIVIDFCLIFGSITLLIHLLSLLRWTVIDLDFLLSAFIIIDMIIKYAYDCVWTNEFVL